MNRKLTTQMCREWSGNIWLVVELTIVTVILWYVGSNLFATYKLYAPDKHYDISRDYVAQINVLPVEADDYVEYDSPDQLRNDLDLLGDQLRNLPMVKAVGFTNNGIPYNYNYYGAMLQYVGGGDTIYYDGNIRGYDAEAIRIMGLKGTRGETSDQIAAEIEAGKILLSTVGYEFETGQQEELPNMEKLRGKTLAEVNKPDRTFSASMIQIEPIRRGDFEPTFGRGTIIKGIGNNVPSELLIRIEPGRDREFLEAMASGSFRAGDFYLTDLKSISQRRDEANNQYNEIVFTSVLQSIFFLLIAFLGILGTYWFRVQERVPEIAIRKVNGATNGDILRRLFGESLLLYAISAVLAVGLEWLMIDKELISETMTFFPRPWLYITMGLTAAAMVMAVLIGIYIPARKAMKIDPALALKDQ